MTTPSPRGKRIGTIKRRPATRRRSAATVEKQAIKEIEQTVERVEEIADAAPVVDEIIDMNALQADNEALREENANLTRMLELRNREYSALLEQQAGVRRLDASHFDRARIPQPLSHNASQERSRRRALTLMPKSRLIALAMKFDGRRSVELDRLGHPELVDLIATTESALRAQAREAARK